MALVDDGVGADRQMRPCCSMAATGNTAIVFIGIEAVEIIGGKVVPPDLAVGHLGSFVGKDQPGVAAIASISTTNSGRAKPETIISVEAG